MTRRDFLAASAACAAAGCGQTDSGSSEPAAVRTNIVFILADDLGYNHLGCYGQTKIRTPRIDRLASEGMRFTSAYSGCTVCAPARSSLMTGLHTGHTPVRGNSGGLPLPADAITVAEVLQQAGYATGIFGKWGLGDAGSDGVPTKQGFDEFLGPLHQIHAQYYWPEFLWRNTEAVRLEGNENGGKAHYAPDVMLEGALEFIRDNKDQPFFLYFPSLVPHHEYQVPEEDLAEYDGKFPEPAPFIREDRGFEIQHKPAATTAAMITRFDRDVGRLLDELAAHGLDENTLVIFTSDNGAAGSFQPIVDPFDPSGPLRGYKSDLYEGGIRIPAIARWTGKIKPGSTSDYPWTFWDFLPTAAEVAGVEPPAEIDGRSFLPVLLGEDQQPPEFLYWEHGEGERLKQAVRMGDWKAVRRAPRAPLELYDLSADLGETTDLAAQHPEVVERIEEYLASARFDPPPAEESGFVRPSFPSLGERQGSEHESAGRG